MTRRPRMRARRGDHRHAPPTERAPVDDRRRRRISTRGSRSFPNLPEDEYESILAVPILAREKLDGRAERPHARAARVHGRRDRAAASRSRAQVAQSIEHAQLYAEAQRRVRRARGAGADLGGRLRVALPRGVARGDRQDDDGRGRRDRRRARARGRRDRVAREARRQHTRSACRCAGSAARSASSSRDRDTPFTDDERALLGVDRAPRRRRARARARGDARRARPGDPPPRQEQPPDRRVAAAPAGARRGRRRPAQGARATRSTGSSRSRRCTRC